MITRDDLIAICPRPKSGAKRAIWDGYADAILSPEGVRLFKQYGCYTPARMAMFMGAVVAPETAMTVLRESGAYTAQGILRVFGVGRHSSKITEREALWIASLPVNADGSGPRCDALFERAYGLGIPHCCHNVHHCTKPRQACQARSLGNSEPGDGAKFRGLGLNQATGRDAQEEMADAIGCELEDLPTPIHALQMALMEWDRKGCSEHADRGGEQGVINVRKLINGGSLRIPTSRVNGIPEALRAYASARRVITAADFQDTGVEPVALLDTEPADVDTPPPTLAHSTEVQTAAMTGGGGSVSLFQGIQNAVMKSADTGHLTWSAIALALLAEPLVWAGAVAVFGAAYWFFKRKWRFDTRRV